MAHAYAHIWKIPTTVFRFFSVYGPWGRPDMALFKFTKAILADEPIDVYNHGQMDRDFTYVDDIANAITLLVDAVPGDPTPAHETDDDLGLSPVAPFRVVNIGNGDPVRLLAFIEAIEASIGKTAIRNYLPMQPGDVPATFADTGLLRRLTGFQPATPVSSGVDRFVASLSAHRASQHHGSSDSRLVRSTSGRCISGRHGAPLDAPRSRPHLWRRLPAPTGQHGHRRSRLSAGESLAESIPGATDRIGPTGMPEPCDRARGAAPATSPVRVSALLPWGANASPSRRTHPRHDASTRRRKVAWWHSRKWVDFTIATNDAQPDVLNRSAGRR